MLPCNRVQRETPSPLTIQDYRGQHYSCLTVCVTAKYLKNINILRCNKKACLSSPNTEED